MRDPALRRFFDNLMKLSGVEKDVLVTSPEQEYAQKRVDAHLLSYDGVHAILVNNEGESAIDVTITVPAAAGVTSARELFSGQSVSVTQAGGAQFSLHLAAEDGAMVLLS